MDPWVGIASVLAALTTLILALRLLQQKLGLHPELVRKLLHVGMGGVVLAFPWMFTQAWPVVLLGLVAAGALVALRFGPQLPGDPSRVLGAVDRQSLGEVYYPLAVALLFTLSLGDWLLYVVPVLMLVIADAVAALIGVRYGVTKFQTADGFKSLEGSLAFFVAAFLSAHVPLLLLSDTGRAQTLMLALILALLVMLLEAVAWRGLDNLFIPLGCYALLKLYMHESEQALLLRLVATVVLVAFSLAWRRRTALDDSALIGAALFGYAAWMIGGWPWLLAPLAVFLGHVLLWPRLPGARRHYTIHTVMAVTAPGFLWLMVDVVGGRHEAVLPFSAVFAAHLALSSIGAVRLPAALAAKPWLEPAAAALAAWLVAAVPALVALLVLHPENRAVFAVFIDVVLGIAGVGGAVLLYQWTWKKVHVEGVPLPGALALTCGVGLLASLVAAGRLLTHWL